MNRIDAIGADLIVTAGRLTRSIAHRVQKTDKVVSWRALAILEQHERLTVGGLAALYSCSQPAATKIVAGLTERGWVERTRDTSDGRISHISLTAEGREHLEYARTQAVALMRPTLAELDEADLEALERASAIMARMAEAELAATGAAAG